MDIVPRPVRSRMMAAVRTKNTKPEILVRAELHRRGLRFRLHAEDLPGRPDIVLPRWRTVVCVNGCFWHGHGCSLSKLPKSNKKFWSAKLAANRARDFRTMAELKNDGWNVLVIWQCEIALGTPSEIRERFDSLAAAIRSHQRNRSSGVNSGPTR
jgi:DNA mismatch endonuclease (patch repair protein)